MALLLLIVLLVAFAAWGGLSVSPLLFLVLIIAVVLAVVGERRGL